MKFVLLALNLFKKTVQAIVADFRFSVEKSLKLFAGKV